MPNFLNKIVSILAAMAMRMIRVNDVSEGSFGSCHYQYATLKVSQHVVHQIVIDLPAGIGGDFQIVPADGQEALWDNSQRLESIEFNTRMDVYASNTALAFRVLAPDFMAWLMDLSRMPQICILDKRCFVAFLDSNMTNEAELQAAEKILNFIQRSGALEPVKKAEPLVSHK